MMIRVDEQNRGFMLVLWGLFLTFAGWSIGLILPILIETLLEAAYSILLLLALFFGDIIIILVIRDVQEKIPLASALLFLFGLSNGITSIVIVYTALLVVPLHILLSVFGILALFFLLELILAVLIKIESYPYIFILSILIVGLILAIIQIFIPFLSTISIIIDLIIIGIFGIVLFFDLQLIRQEPQDWAEHALSIFLDLLNIILRVLIILIKMYMESQE